jgi:hypothetical protein
MSTLMCRQGKLCRSLESARVELERQREKQSASLIYTQVLWMRRRVFNVSLWALLLLSLAGLCAGRQATQAKQRLYPITHGKKADGLPQRLTARGTVTRVHYAPPRCGELIFPATLEVKLDGKLRGYNHPFLYLVVPCLYQTEGADKLLNRRLEINVAKQVANRRPCFYDIGESSLDSGGVPFYCASREELLKAIMPELVSTPTEAIEFEGTLAEGATYRALSIFDETQAWRPVAPLKLPFHHAGRIEWLNLKDFSALTETPAGSRLKKIVFRVIEKKIAKVYGQYRWNTTYYCRIIAVEKETKS